MDYIKLEGSMILPARVEGSPDVFLCPRFVLMRPEWIPDSNSAYCELCNSKFTKIKRKHHCRMCGAIRCAKCCNEKMPLPQLGLHEPERVCDYCQEISTVVTRARSPDDHNVIEASKALAAYCRHDIKVKRVIELGGVQTLIMLAISENIQILRNVASGLHCLSSHPPLHKHLADAGAIKAFCRILSRIGDSDEQVIIDVITALMIFCRSPDLKAKALKDGGLHPVLNLCWSSRTAISLLAIRTLGLIVEHTDNHASIFDTNHDAVGRLLRLTTSPDEQIQEVVLKTLAFLSTGGSIYKHKLLQADYSSGRCLERVFNSCPGNSQILCNAACVIANLATSEEDQISLGTFMDAVTRKLPTSEDHTELMCHLTRALANFAEFSSNASRLVESIPNVVNYVLRKGPAPAKEQALRFLLNVLGHLPSTAAALLTKNDPETFLTNLGEATSFKEIVTTSFAQTAPAIMKPM